MKISMIKPILITGSHRSGSTWVGKMIAQSSDVGYIHEPFSLLHRPGLCNNKFKYWFTYICEENESQYIDNFTKCFQFNYNLLLDLKNFVSFKDTYYSIRDLQRFTYYKIKNCRPLIKDPIALFSAEWLAKRFNMEVIILIRHPAAFAGSLKEIKWFHPFEHFLKQPLLMKHCLNNYRRQINEYVNNRYDIIDQAILLWNLIHDTILKYKNNHPEWKFYRHEDISMNPVEEFRNLYQKLGINFSKNVRQKIVGSSSSKKRGIIKRDSRSNIWSWKHRLSEGEINKVYEGTKNISMHFYSDKNWL